MTTKHERAVAALDSKTTHEFTKTDWKLFKAQWIGEWAEGLRVECGMKMEESYEQAKYDWEQYCTQEGWTGRDEEIGTKRETKSRKPSMVDALLEERSGNDRMTEDEWAMADYQAKLGEHEMMVERNDRRAVPMGPSEEDDLPF